MQKKVNFNFYNSGITELMNHLLMKTVSFRSYLTAIKQTLQQDLFLFVYVVMRSDHKSDFMDAVSVPTAMQALPTTV